MAIHQIVQKPTLETYTMELNQKCISLQEVDKEAVHENIAYEAYAIVKKHEI